MNISMTRNNTQAIFALPPLEIACGIGSDGILQCSGKVGIGARIPDDFYNGERKHLIITYNSATDFEVYIDGEKAEKVSDTYWWTLGSLSNSSYLGKRELSGYNPFHFSGVIYEFNIYEGLVSEAEIF